jgi:hypothetical protein
MTRMLACLLILFGGAMTSLPVARGAEPATPAAAFGEALLVTVVQTAGAAEDHEFERGAECGKNLAGISTGRRIGNRRRQVMQTLRVASGREGWLLIGRREPYVSSWSAGGGFQSDYAEQVDLQQMTRGLRLRPRLQGRQVDLELEVSDETPTAPCGRPDALQATRFSGAVSNVTVPLDCWTAIAMDVVRLAAAEEESRRIGNFRQGLTIWVKIALPAGSAGN